MSGSPIIQDGKLIGAVTHVFISSPDQGYGVYIDWMLEETNKIEEKNGRELLCRSLVSISGVELLFRFSLCCQFRLN